MVSGPPQARHLGSANRKKVDWDFLEGEFETAIDSADWVVIEAFGSEERILRDNPDPKVARAVLATRRAILQTVLRTLLEDSLKRAWREGGQ